MMTIVALERTGTGRIPGETTDEIGIKHFLDLS